MPQQAKDGPPPSGAGRFWAATSSLVLDVPQRVRWRPRSLSRSKIVTAKVPIIYWRLRKCLYTHH